MEHKAIHRPTSAGKGYDSLPNETQQLILDLQNLKLRAANLNLGGVAKAIDEAVKKLGWDLAKLKEME